MTSNGTIELQSNQIYRAPYFKDNITVNENLQLLAIYVSILIWTPSTPVSS